jgi:hypothetical protein
MTTRPIDATWPRHVLRGSTSDGLLVALSGLHALALLVVPSIPLVAIGLWWNANTIAHNFIHHPFFRSRKANRCYALFLSAVLGLPQSVWRERHLAHHAGRPVRLRLTRDVAVEGLVVLSVWLTAAMLAPHAFFLAYLPGWAMGLGLCFLQGHYEHAHGTTSHYGRIYNTLFFNDGYHVEHHAQPGRHWSELGAVRAQGRASRWPPVLRWLDGFTLEGLERLVLRKPRLQRAVLAAHERAFWRLQPALGDVRSVLIVGGGLFPRTALVLRRVLPDATLTVIDARAEHLDEARRFLDDRIVWRHELYTGGASRSFDLVVFPLAYLGNRRCIYEDPPAPLVLVHDWIWSPRGQSVMIAPWLLKRLNLVASRDLRQVTVPLTRSA